MLASQILVCPVLDRLYHYVWPLKICIVIEQCAAIWGKINDSTTEVKGYNSGVELTTGLSQSYIKKIQTNSSYP